LPTERIGDPKSSDSRYDFIAIRGDPTPPEVTFEYIRSNTNTSETSASTSVHGIDDFKVAIVGE
jgi:hypothetical protein